MKRRNLFAVAMAGVLASGSLAACGETANTEKAKQGGTAATVLNVGMPNGPQTENHNPFLSTSAGASLGYRWQIYEPLMMWNPVKPAEPAKPWLAEKVEWAPDFKSVKITVRDGATWNDGKPVTAEDVAFTYDMIKKHEALNQFAIPYASSAASGKEVTLTFGAPQFVNQNRIVGQVPIVPKHVWSAVKDPATEVNKNPVGSGPFTLKSFTPQTTTLTARPSGYWQTRPAVNELRYTSYTDGNAQATALANGEAEWSFVFIPNYKQTFIAKDPQNHKMWAPAILGIHALYINTTKKPFDNPVLRRAMDMVVNRNDIYVQAEAEYFHPEIKSVTGLPTPAGEPFIAPEYKGKEHKVDVEGARKLLTDNGFTFAGDKLTDPSGKAVSLVLTDPAGWNDYQTGLEIVKDNLAQIGISATVDKANQDAWFKNVEEGKFDATFRWTNGGATPYDIYQTIMDGSLLKPIGKASTAGNFGRFNNPAATAALKAYANAADDAARTTAMNTLQKIFVEQVPAISVGADNSGGAYSTKNWVGWPDDTNPYASGQPSMPTALEVVLKLKPANS